MVVKVLGVKGKEELTVKLVIDAIKSLEKKGLKGTFFIHKPDEKVDVDYGTISENHITYTVKGKPNLFDITSVIKKDAIFVVSEDDVTFGYYPVIPVEGVENGEQLAEFIMERGFILPGLNCKACGEDSCKSMMEKIVNRERSIEECPVLSSTVEVICGGKKLALSPFVCEVISSTIKGLLSTLKGYEEGEIRIKIGAK